MITIRYNCSTFATAKTENELINHSLKNNLPKTVTMIMTILKSFSCYTRRNLLITHTATRNKKIFLNKFSISLHTQEQVNDYNFHIEIDYLVSDKMVFLLRCYHIVNNRNIVGDNIDPDTFA
jgi:hypothetical protein